MFQFVVVAEFSVFGLTYQPFKQDSPWIAVNLLEPPITLPQFLAIMLIGMVYKGTLRLAVA